MMSSSTPDSVDLDDTQRYIVRPGMGWSLAAIFVRQNLLAVGVPPVRIS
jgi:hypothetical protein